MYSLPDGTFSSDEDEEEEDEDEEEDEEGEDNGLFLTSVPFSIILFLSGYLCFWCTFNFPQQMKKIKASLTTTAASIMF